MENVKQFFVPVLGQNPEQCLPHTSLSLSNLFWKYQSKSRKKCVFTFETVLWTLNFGSVFHPHVTTWIFKKTILILLQNFNQPAVKRCTYSGCAFRKYLHKNIPQSCLFFWVILQQIENIVYCNKYPHTVVSPSGYCWQKNSNKYFICKKYPDRVVCSSGYYWQIVGDGKAATFILLVTDEMTMTMI